MIDQVNEFDLEAFKAYVLGHPEMAEPSLLDNEGIPADWEPFVQFAFNTSIQVEDRTIEIIGAIPNYFPLSLPLFRLLDPQSCGCVPHVGPYGSVCYYESEGIVIDRKRPKAVFDFALDKLKEELRKGICGENEQDYLTEIRYYWETNPLVLPGVSVVSPDHTKVREVVLAALPPSSLRPGEGIAIIVADSNEELDEVLLELAILAKYFKAFFIPISHSDGFQPPSWGSFYTKQEFEQNVLNRMSRKNRKALDRLRRELKLPVEFFILGLSLPNGTTSILGAQIVWEQNKTQQRISFDKRKPKIIRPMAIQRVDPEYLIERGGGMRGMHDKKVLVVGCGAVGSIVAMELAKAGVGTIGLCDYDIISIDNSHRHLVGFSDSIYQTPKSSTVGLEIRRKIREVKIKDYPGSLQTCLHEGSLNLEDFDLIIAATGNMTSDLFLNESLLSNKDYPPCIFTWVEPLGIGGHSLLTNNGVSHGCLNCLFDMEQAEDQFYNRASFAATGQYFGKTIAGCTSYFTPFSSLDANRTAVEAVKLALQTLSGREKGNPLISWKGDSHDFLQAGFKLASRFKLSQNDLYNYRYDYPLAHCPVCGKRGVER